MPVNGVWQSFQPSFTLESDSPAYIVVSKILNKRTKIEHIKEKMKQQIQWNIKITSFKTFVKCERFRWFAIRRRSARMVAKEPIPPAWVEHFYVCINCHINCIRTVYRYVKLTINLTGGMNWTFTKFFFNYFFKFNLRTAFLLQCFKPPPTPTPVHVKQQ